MDAYARVDRKACLEKGQDVMGKLLLEIQVRKSTGDGPGATGPLTNCQRPLDGRAHTPHFDSQLSTNS